MNQGLTDLQAAIDALTVSVGNVATALSNAANDPDATVETMAQAINTQVAALNAALPPVATAAAAAKP